ncbi:phospholipase A [Sphingomonas cannabina]|uniref:phospholipase A n=1 Tax=Sphingomonas cannabina TaxID=2899123 RepID=UPI001F3521CE|nr:phospholipase A [Sphingomonas cannabina]UIJ45509.1 phospholipase A [Sphingomonas cannabina]
MRLLPLILAAAATPAAAQVRQLPAPIASAEAARQGVDIYLVNEGEAAQSSVPPARLEITAADGTRLVLEPVSGSPAEVPAHGFVKLGYRLAETGVAAAQPAPPAAAPIARETVVASGNGEASGFLDRFAPYEPIYGVVGADDAGAKLQVSFALKPFGGDGLLSRFTFAYTQTMFWAIDRPSAPFRSTTYSPEAFFDIPVAHDLNVAAGFRHDSNGEDGPGSISVNRLTLRAAKRFDLGDGWHAELVPQVWAFLDDTSGLDRYWGYTSLKAAIGQADGIKLSVTARGNPGTGKGGAELFASYPLAGVGDGIGIYLFGQAFTGYGEALDDYRINDTHARFGIALTR